MGKEIQVRTFLGMFLGDTPQRSDFGCLKRHNCDVPCVQCLVKSDDLYTEIIGTSRTVAETNRLFNIWKSKTTKGDKKEFAKQYGIKPIEDGRSYYKNPFWRLYYLYGFDIYQDSVIDWFHLGPIGIFKRFVDYIHEDVLSKQGTEDLANEAKQADFSIFNRALPSYKVSLI